MHYLFFFILTLALASGVDAGSLHSTSDLSRTAQIKSQVEKAYILDRSKTDWEWMMLIQDAIVQANRYENSLKPKEVSDLSKKIVQVSKCYAIDPGMFAALIWRESNFIADAISFRGAVGLTQMTQTGVREVLERVTPHSPRKLKFLSSILRKCNPKITKNLPKVISADTVAATKNQIWASPEHGLVFGALLLKLNLALVKDRPMKGRYLKAFERYNGDPRVKVRFASDVLSFRDRLSAPKFLKSASRF